MITTTSRTKLTFGLTQLRRCLCWSRLRVFRWNIIRASIIKNLSSSWKYRYGGVVDLLLSCNKVEEELKCGFFRRKETELSFNGREIHLKEGVSNFSRLVNFHAAMRSHFRRTSLSYTTADLSSSAFKDKKIAWLSHQPLEWNLLLECHTCKSLSVCPERWFCAGTL